jgi:glucose-6-phosphate 1-dehydrogenase
VKFKRPPHDAFGLGGSAAANALRFRINPGNRAVLTLVGKKPGAGWLPETQELTFTEHPGADMRPYDRLIGAALGGERWLFAQQDSVEAAWAVVDPVLGDVVPVVPYARGAWGADSTSLLPRRDLVRPGRVIAQMLNFSLITSCQAVRHDCRDIHYRA